MLCNTRLLLNTVICIIKMEVFFLFCIVYLLSLESETSLNYSAFDRS